ncbi:MAG: thiamine-phosphate kinase [Wenzhouxiangella sp.]|nr:thiamine-phosphate kinase [Wenzhouxiangella sp.]
MNEFALIERIRRRAAADGDSGILIGIGDDAAVLEVAPGRALVASTDSLLPGRHFLADSTPADIGHLAAAVNLSDLAAMGARPRWALLALTLPEGDSHWLDGFLDGFLPLCAAHDTRLVGGNLSAGPLNIGVQLLGDIEPGRIARRGRAQAGDVLLVTGSLGDAAAALALAETASADLLARLRRPTPRVEAGQLLAGMATAMIDVSDGLLADLGHLLGPAAGARIAVEKLPCSAALAASAIDPTRRWRLQLNGGSDYELLLSLPAVAVDTAISACAELGVPLSPIGQVDGSGRIACRLADGNRLEIADAGWDHFQSR